MNSVQTLQAEVYDGDGDAAGMHPTGAVASPHTGAGSGAGVGGMLAPEPTYAAMPETKAAPAPAPAPAPTPTPTPTPTHSTTLPHTATAIDVAVNPALGKVRGLCADCGCPVYSSQPRDVNEVGVYMHANPTDCLPPNTGTASVANDRGAGAGASAGAAGAAPAVVRWEVLLSRTPNWGDRCTVLVFEEEASLENAIGSQIADCSGLKPDHTCDPITCWCAYSSYRRP
jgi:hypothetical protein